MPLTPPAEHTAPAPEMRFPDARQAVALVALVLAAQGALLLRGFVWDDRIFLDHLALAGRWPAFGPDPFGFVRPGKSLAFELFFRLFGGASALPWQAALLALAVGTVLAFARLASHLLRPQGAFAAAAVFAVHPLHAEATGWFSAANGTVAALLVVCYCLALRERRGGWALPTALMAGAVLFREDAAVAPLLAAVLLLAAGEPRAAIPWRWLGAHLALAAAWMIWHRVAAQGALQQLEAAPLPAALMPLQVPWVLAVHAFWFACPFVWGSYRTMPGGAAPVAGLVAGWAVLAGAVALGRRRWPQGRTPALFLLFYALAMLPMANPLPMGNPPFGVRYLALAGMGLALMAGWVVEQIPRGRVLLGAWLLAAGATAALHHSYWRSDLTLFRHLAEVNGDARSQVLAAERLLAAGQPAEALRFAEAALVLDPATASAQVARGVALQQAGRAAEASAAWEEALRLDPTSTAAAGNLATAIEERFAASGDPKDFDRADALYRQASASRRADGEAAYLNRGVMHATAGRLEEAARIWQEGVAAFPGSADLRRNLAMVRRDLATRPAPAGT